MIGKKYDNLIIKRYITEVITLSIFWLWVRGLAVISTPLWYTQEYRDDCNLVLQDTNKLPTNLGFFTPDDIIKAYNNTLANCPPNKPDGSLLPSVYLFDHLITIGVAKLEWKAETIGLKSDPAGSAIKALREKILQETKNDTIGMIPASFQQEYNTIRDHTGTYLPLLAQAGVYSGSSGLYSKYSALCSLARWVYLRTNDVVKIKQGSTNYILDNSYYNCIRYTQSLLSNLINTQSSYQYINAQSVTTKIKEAINQDTKEQLNLLKETTENAKNSFNEVSKKIDQSIQNCNITDV